MPHEAMHVTRLCQASHSSDRKDAEKTLTLAVCKRKYGVMD